MKKLLPMNDNVLIRRKEEEKMTAGGLLHIPSTAQADNMTCEVLAVGTGRILETGHVVPMSVKPGDVILVPPQSGIKVRFDGEDFLMIQEYNILATISE